MKSIDPSAWIAASAEMYGNVTVGERSSIWPRAVMRAECHEIRIGNRTNIQDFVMLHVGYDHPTIIGDHCSIAHHATIHGATIEDDCLIGINATIMDGAVIGKGSIVGGGALVKEGAIFPPASIIVGTPAKLKATRDCTRENRLNAWKYVRNAEAYRDGDHRAWDGDAYASWLAAKIKEIDEDLGRSR